MITTDLPFLLQSEISLCNISHKMISAKKLITMARRWQKVTNIRRKRITFPRPTGKGHFVMYTADQGRFVLPLEYLNKEIFKELFRMAEEVFGLPRNGPIKLPCDAASMEYVIAMIQNNIEQNLEKALAIAIETGCCPSCSYGAPDLPNQQTLICSF
jgi:hypothetical protein